MSYRTHRERSKKEGRKKKNTSKLRVEITKRRPGKHS